jgi:hypothetical protein
MRSWWFAFVVVVVPQCSPSPASNDAGSDAGGEGGGCSHDCLGGACNAGMCAPVAIASKLNGVVNLAQMTDRVFWTEYPGNEIASADKVDASLNVLAGYPIADSPWGIATDDSFVYVVNSGSASTILRCPPSQCDQSTVLYDGGLQPTVIALAGNFAYWAEPFVDSISRMPKSGGAVQQLATPDTSNSTAQYACIVSDGTYVYWSEPQNGLIRRQAVAAQPQTVFTLQGTSFPMTLLIDGTTLYFVATGTSNGAGVIGYGNLDGTGGVQVVAPGQHFPWGLATDATYLYWTTEGDFDAKGNPMNNGGVFRCEKTGCTTPVQLADGLADARGIVVDDTAIYFGTFATGTNDSTVWRLAK